MKKNILIYLLVFFGFQVAKAQTQIGQDINGNLKDFSGTSVAISSNGKIMAFGSSGVSPYVSLYENKNGTWQSGLTVFSYSYYDGSFVSLSADGSIIAFGTPNSGTGLVRVFKYVNGVMTKLGQDIVGNAAYLGFGSSVDLSADGSIIAIGAPSASVNGEFSGQVSVYKYTNNAWVQVGQGINGISSNAKSGGSISLSLDGNVLAIGSRGASLITPNGGLVRVYHNVNNTWVQLGQDISGEEYFGELGTSVSLSSDGSMVAIGAPMSDGKAKDSGKVRVYKISNDIWTQVGKDIEGRDVGDWLGYSVSLSDNGDAVAIGVPKSGYQTTDHSGRVQIFKNINGSWAQIGQDINGETLSDNSGYAVGLSGDASTVVIGAPNNHDNGDPSGQVRVYNIAGIPIFNQINPICYGDTSIELPTVSTNGISGTWQPPFNNTSTTTYTFTPDIGQNAQKTILTVMVNPIITPIFDAIAPICAGGYVPELPTTSINGIIGTWSPALNNTATTTYTFTPNAGVCASTTKLTILVVESPVTKPTFNPIPDICSGTILSLPLTSLEGIVGFWSPAFNRFETTTYTFAPIPGQCASSTTLTVAVKPKNPTFNVATTSCYGYYLAALPTTSLEGIKGTWSPALNRYATTTYTFTPSAGQCALSTTLTITVQPLITPTFNTLAPICYGETIPPLPTTSINGITGIWSPSLNKYATTTYTFNPTSGQCAKSATLTIEVIGTTPTFDVIAPICSGQALDPLPTTSNEGIEGTWSPALDNKETRTYTFTPTAGQCAKKTTLTIEVKTTVQDFYGGTSSILCDFMDLRIVTDNPAQTFQWQYAIDVNSDGNVDSEWKDIEGETYLYYFVDYWQISNVYPAIKYGANVHYRVLASDCGATNEYILTVYGEPSYLIVYNNVPASTCVTEPITIEGLISGSGFYPYNLRFTVDGNAVYDVSYFINNDFSFTYTPSVNDIGKTLRIELSLQDFQRFCPSQIQTYYVSVDDCDPTLSVYNASIKEQKNIFSIYPNPVQTKLNIDVSEVGDLDILSIDGKVVLTRSLKSIGKTEFNIEDLNAGVYLCRFSSGKSVKVLKLVKL